MNNEKGWWLPGRDNYFGKFITEAELPGVKKNGFQVDHLFKALEYVEGWDLALDVGAHVGFWTVPMSERFKTVYAFEPAEDTFACLKRNTEGLDNVHPFHTAVGEKAGTCSVYEDPKREGNTGSRYIGDGETTRMMAVDNMNLLACNFIKFDVEGYEARAIEGAWKTIKKFRPVILMECDKHFSLKRYGTPDDEAQNMLTSIGYKEVAHMRPDKIFTP